MELRAAEKKRKRKRKRKTEKNEKKRKRDEELNPWNDYIGWARQALTLG